MSKRKGISMEIQNNQSIGIVFALVDTIKSNKEYLGEIDGAIGDGDHGINMAKGFTMAGDRFRSEKITSLGQGLSTLGDVLLMDIGGSMGPLYGTFFGEMGEVCSEHEIIDCKIFADMITAGYTGILSLSKAKLGDKSLIDCLTPAREAYINAMNNGGNFACCLNDMKAAAYIGWQSTKDMVAKIGRASRLGERSRGTLDAGATSCYLILSCLCDEILKSL